MDDAFYQNLREALQLLRLHNGTITRITKSVRREPADTYRLQQAETGVEGALRRLEALIGDN